MNETESVQGLYILKCHKFYKIGITNNVKKRVSILQIGNPYKIELVSFFGRIPAIYLERFLHQALREFRISGEWFSFGRGEIKTLVDFIERLDKDYFGEVAE